MQTTGCWTSTKRPATMRHKGLQRTVMTCEMQLLASIIALTSYICQATFILTFCAGEWKPFLFLLHNNLFRTRQVKKRHNVHCLYLLGNSPASVAWRTVQCSGYFENIVMHLWDLWKPKSLVYLNPCPARKRQRVPRGHDSESAKPVGGHDL